MDRRKFITSVGSLALLGGCSFSARIESKPIETETKEVDVKEVSYSEEIKRKLEEVDDFGYGNRVYLYKANKETYVVKNGIEKTNPYDTIKYCKDAYTGKVSSIHVVEDVKHMINAVDICPLNIVILVYDDMESYGITWYLNDMDIRIRNVTPI